MKCVSIAFGTLAGVVLAVAAIPFATWQPALSSWAADGTVTSFTPERYERLRIAAATVAMLLGVAAIQATRSPNALQNWWAARIAGGRDQLHAARDALQHDAVLIGASTLLALGLRLPYADQPLRYDEAYTWLEYASQPLYLGLSLYHDPNNHLGHTLLVHLSSQVFGDAPWALRLPALVAGTMLAPACAVVLRRWGRAAQWIAGLAVAAHPVLIEFSTLARGYALLALLIVALVGLTWNVVRPTGTPHLWCWSTVASLALWTVPTSLYAVAGCLLWLLAQSRAERAQLLAVAKLAALTGLLTVGLYAPVLIFSGPAAILSNPHVQPLPWAEFVDRIPAAVTQTRDFLLLDSPPFVVALGALAVLVALARAPDHHNLRTLTAALLLGTGLTVLQRVHPPARIWIYFVPLTIGLGSIGWATILQASAGLHWLRVLATLLAASAITTPLVRSIATDSIRRSPEGGAFPGARGAAALLHQVQRTDEPVLAACPAHAPLVYYALQFGMNRHDFPARWPPASTAPSLLLVVNQTTGETPAGLLRGFGLPRAWHTARRETLAKEPDWQLVRVTPTVAPRPQ